MAYMPRVFSLIRVSFFFTIGFSCYWLSGAGGELQCAILTCIILGITGQMLHVLTNLIWNSSREDGDQV